MALKTNSKKVRERIRQHIVDGFNPEYAERNPEAKTFPEIAAEVMFVYKRQRGKYRNVQDSFIEWLQGDPSIIDVSYYYKSAVDMLGDILEQTSEERNRYTERQAEWMFSYLIYAECSKYDEV